MVKRKIYISDDKFEELLRFFQLNEEEISKLAEIAKSDVIETVEDFCVEIINTLNTNDQDAIAIFLSYSYLVSNMVRLKMDFTETYENLLDAGIRANNENFTETLSEAVKAKLKGYEKLFSIDTSESMAIKRAWLASKVANSVMSVNIICDFRPVFDKTRTKIEDVIQLYTLELIVTDSTGGNEAICVNFNDDTYTELCKQVEIGKKKMKIMRPKIDMIKGETSDK